MIEAKQNTAPVLSIKDKKATSKKIGLEMQNNKLNQSASNIDGASTDTVLLPFVEVLKILRIWSDYSSIATPENIEKLTAFANKADTEKYNGKICFSCFSGILRSKKISAEVVEKLFMLLWVKGGDIHYVDASEGNLLHQAILGDRRHIFDILLAEKLDVNARDHFEMTPMHWAIMANRSYYVEKLLVNRKKPDLTLKDYKSRTALGFINDKTDPHIILAINRYLEEKRQNSLFSKCSKFFSSIFTDSEKELQQAAPSSTSETREVPLMPTSKSDTAIRRRAGKYATKNRHINYHVLVSQVDDDIEHEATQKK